jgi:diguanylate cyclase (GGDEF)-like protein/PAS domain S-box-containing protein
MHLSTETYQEIIANLRDGLYIVDRERRIVYWNASAERISGFKQEEVVGSSCADNILCHVDAAGGNLCGGHCPLATTIEQGISRDAEIYLRHKNGHRVPVSVRITALRDDDGNVIGGVETFSDLSSRAADELRFKELEKLALLDRLTQIANRHYLERELEARLEELKRYGTSFGVMFMDIDNFKLVNDRYGHEMGDRVLQFVAGTLSSNSRSFDVYGRWGGEEFVGIARNVDSANLEQTGQRLRKLVEKSFLMVDGKRLGVTISIGATMATKTDTIATLIQRADELMYLSKSAGRNRLTMG